MRKEGKRTSASAIGVVARAHVEGKIDVRARTTSRCKSNGQGRATRQATVTTTAAAEAAGDGRGEGRMTDD